MRLSYVMISLFLFPLVFAQTAEPPTWEVGDEWAWGSTWDIDNFLRNLANQVPQLALTEASGEFSCYSVQRVAALRGGEYVTSVRVGMELRDFKVTGSYKSPEHGLEPLANVSLSASGWLKANGEFTYTQQLALHTLSLSGNGELEAALTAPGFSSSFEFWNFDLGLSATYDPPADIFNFPIQVEEEWEYSGAYSGRGRVSCEVKMRIEMGDYENTWENSFSYEDTFSEELTVKYRCRGITQVQTGGKELQCFEIEVTSEGQKAPIFILLYSPEKKNFVGLEVNWLGLFFQFEPFSEHVKEAAEQTPVGPLVEEMDMEGVLRSTEETVQFYSVSPSEAEERIEGMGGREGLPIELEIIPPLAIAIVIIATRLRK